MDKTVIVRGPESDDGEYSIEAQSVRPNTVQLTLEHMTITSKGHNLL